MANITMYADLKIDDKYLDRLKSSLNLLKAESSNMLIEQLCNDILACNNLLGFDLDGAIATFQAVDKATQIKKANAQLEKIKAYLSRYWLEAYLYSRLCAAKECRDNVAVLSEHDSKFVRKPSNLYSVGTLDLQGQHLCKFEDVLTIVEEGRIHPNRIGVSDDVTHFYPSYFFNALAYMCYTLTPEDKDKTVDDLKAITILLEKGASLLSPSSVKGGIPEDVFDAIKNNVLICIDKGMNVPTALRYLMKLSYQDIQSWFKFSESRFGTEKQKKYLIAKHADFFDREAVLAKASKIVTYDQCDLFQQVYANLRLDFDLNKSDDILKRFEDLSDYFSNNMISEKHQRAFLTLLKLVGAEVFLLTVVPQIANYSYDNLLVINRNLAAELVNNSDQDVDIKEIFSDCIPNLFDRKVQLEKLLADINQKISELRKMLNGKVNLAAKKVKALESLLSYLPLDIPSIQKNGVSLIDCENFYNFAGDIAAVDQLIKDIWTIAEENENALESLSLLAKNSQLQKNLYISDSDSIYDFMSDYMTKSNKPCRFNIDSAKDANRKAIYESWTKPQIELISTKLKKLFINNKITQDVYYYFLLMAHQVTAAFTYVQKPSPDFICIKQLSHELDEYDLDPNGVLDDNQFNALVRVCLELEHADKARKEKLLELAEQLINRGALLVVTCRKEKILPLKVMLAIQRNLEDCVQFDFKIPELLTYLLHVDCEKLHQFLSRPENKRKLNYYGAAEGKIVWLLPESDPRIMRKLISKQNCSVDFTDARMTLIDSLFKVKNDGGFDEDGRRFFCQKIFDLKEGEDGKSLRMVKDFISLIKQVGVEIFLRQVTPYASMTPEDNDEIFVDMFGTFFKKLRLEPQIGWSQRLATFIKASYDEVLKKHSKGTLNSKQVDAVDFDSAKTYLIDMFFANGKLSEKNSITINHFAVQMSHLENNEINLVIVNNFIELIELVGIDFFLDKVGVYLTLMSKNADDFFVEMFSEFLNDVLEIVPTLKNYNYTILDIKNQLSLNFETRIKTIYSQHLKNFRNLIDEDVSEQKNFSLMTLESGSDQKYKLRMSIIKILPEYISELKCSHSGDKKRLEAATALWDSFNDIKDDTIVFYLDNKYKEIFGKYPKLNKIFNDVKRHLDNKGITIVWRSEVSTREENTADGLEGEETSDVMYPL